MLELEAANIGKVLVIGHTGAKEQAPENTMISFKMGYGLGIDIGGSDHPDRLRAYLDRRGVGWSRWH